MSVNRYRKSWNLMNSSWTEKLTQVSVVDLILISSADISFRLLGTEGCSRF